MSTTNQAGHKTIQYKNAGQPDKHVEVCYIV
jgi:hypothetical protein